LLASSCGEEEGGGRANPDAGVTAGGGGSVNDAEPPLGGGGQGGTGGAAGQGGTGGAAGQGGIGGAAGQGGIGGAAGQGGTDAGVEACRQWVEDLDLAACTLHVATTGSDTGTGASNDPMRTIQQAVDVASAGDHICVEAGNYPEDVVIQTSGEEAHWLVLSTAAEAVVRSLAIQADHVVLDGFVVQDAAGVGIAVKCHHNLIRNNLVVDSASYGINVVGYWSDVYTDSTHNTLIGNRVQRAHTAGIQIFGTGNRVVGNEISATRLAGDADGIRFFGDAHLVAANYIHDIRTSEAPGAHIDCFQTWGPATNVRFDSNYCDNPDDSMQGTMIEQINNPVRGFTFVNNVFRMGASGYGPGINVHAAPGQDIIEDMVIVNNTFARTSGAGEYSIRLTRVQGALIENNLFYDGVLPPVQAVDSTEVEQDYNLVFRTNGGEPDGTPAAHDLWQTDPQMVDAAAGDYRLLATSPAIDAGASVSELLTYDHAGTPRPQMAGWDVGAFEWSGSPCGYAVPTAAR
jgi:hypothetical protein